MSDEKEPLDAKLQRWGKGMQQAGKSVSSFVGAVFVLLVIFAFAKCAGVL